MARFKLWIILTCMAASAVSLTAVWGAKSGDSTSESPVRVGIFDSRAVVMAYIRSDEFNTYLGEVAAESEQAKASGDDARVKELEAQMMAHQKLAHKQVFSTWPADNVLELIKDKIPDIANRAGVDMIVSKWQITYQSPEIELTDVTGHFVKLFTLDDGDLEAIEGLRAMDPLPLEEVEEHEG
jgi:hypothetical protein